MQRPETEPRAQPPHDVVAAVVAAPVGLRDQGALKRRSPHVEEPAEVVDMHPIRRAVPRRRVPRDGPRRSRRRRRRPQRGSRRSEPRPVRRWAHRRQLRRTPGQGPACDARMCVCFGARRARGRPSEPADGLGVRLRLRGVESCTHGACPGLLRCGRMDGFGVFAPSPPPPRCAEGGAGKAEAGSGRGG